MTKATFYQNTKGQCMGFDVCGHAGSGEEGGDIVCAAVSALVINTVNSIERFCDDAFRADAEETEGRISLRLEREPTEACSLLLNSLILGLEDMEDGTYSEFIDIIFEEVQQP